MEALSDVSLSLTCADVKMCLANSKKSSSGPDGVPPRVLRNCSEDLAPFITLVFNLSLKEGCVPYVLKHANVVPVPKCVNAVKPCQFRPISVNPCLSRVLKLVCQKFVIPYISDRLNANQFAYVPCPGKGTVVTLTLMYLHMLRFLDGKSGAVRVAAIDFSKAFDSLSHKVIIDACF